MDEEFADEKIFRKDVKTWLCDNKEADEIFLSCYWIKRIRYSKRLSYCVFWKYNKVGWIQVAEPFGTRLAKPLQQYQIGEAVELCRGYFLDIAPLNIESCAIAMVLRDVPNQWYYYYGCIKKIAIIYQDLDYGQPGIVYKALGFHPYGETVNGRNYLSPSRGDSHGKKVVWAKTLRPISGRHYTNDLPNPFT